MAIEEFQRPLAQANAGDAASAAGLLPLVYDELRRVAQNQMNGERTGHTLEATALVHEAYAKLMGEREMRFADRAHFFAAAAQAMRRILIDHARTKGRLRRGGPQATGRRVPLDVADLAIHDDPDEILAVDDAVRRLEEQDPTAGSVVRLRFYAGLDVDQTAAVLGLSARTVAREWTYARAYLVRALEDVPRVERRDVTDAS